MCIWVRDENGLEYWADETTLDKSNTELDDNTDNNDNECKAPDCYPMADGDGNNNDNNDGNNNDGKDRSHTNSKDNDPCNYYGRDVCDKNKNGCDNEHFDCLTDLPNGDYCTTGMCPGDDRPWKNGSSDSNDNNINNGLTDADRFNSGFDLGCSDGKTAGHSYLNSHPTHTARIYKRL